MQVIYNVDACCSSDQECGSIELYTQTRLYFFFATHIVQVASSIWVAFSGQSGQQWRNVASYRKTL